MALVRQSKDLVTHMVRARVPMPKSTRELAERLGWYRSTVGPAPPESAPVTRLSERRDGDSIAGALDPGRERAH